MNKEIKKRKKEAKKIFYSFMDTRDEYYETLLDYEEKNGFIPYKYSSDVKLMSAYGEYKTYGGWRNIPGVMFVINKAIKIAVKNKTFESQEKHMEKDEKEKHLSTLTKQITEAIAKAKK